MYIRQECIFSFYKLLKFQPETKLKMVLSQFDFSNMLMLLYLSKPKHKRGPNGYVILPRL